MRFILFLLTGLVATASVGQSYTNYLTGSETDLVSDPEGGVCMMGGAGESDDAATWFLERANGGDVLVLRASGSDGYNDYFYEDLGVTLNSVETIVFHSPDASEEVYIHEKIESAEAIWFAGGDQWDYISYWRDSPVDSLINLAIAERNIVIGGTSAGMAILGGYYFSAENGTVTSETALNNPYNIAVTPDSTDFLDVPYFGYVITDTHYDDPDRKGRHATFLSRIFTDYEVSRYGIACDEYTAVCIDESGIARVYGGYPEYDDNAYFIQLNCDLPEPGPEICEEGSPLTWSLDERASRVYAVKGTETGENHFDLSNWKVGSGGEWMFWYIDEGNLSETEGTAPICDLRLESNQLSVNCFPNPSGGTVFLNSSERIERITITSPGGNVLPIVPTIDLETTRVEFPQGVENGVYFIRVSTPSGTKVIRLVLRR